MIWLGEDPRIDNLRDDPRYKDLLERVGIPIRPGKTGTPAPMPVAR
jgi:hypothetical protein